MTREGYVGVTAILTDDGETVERVDRVAGYRFDVTNAGTVDVELGGAGSGSTDFSASDAAPGHTGNKTITVGNNGTASGTVWLYVRNVSGAENGFAEAEAEVDSNAQSELLNLFGIRVALEDSDGRSYALGSDDSYVTLGGYPQTQFGSFTLSPGDYQRVVIEWQIPERAGNEVMTDSVSFDLQFELVSDGTA